MQGQWIGQIKGDVVGTLRVELDRRGSLISGKGYLFYAPELQLPGFKFVISMPDIAPYKTEVSAEYCYSNGGVFEDRNEAEKIIIERFGAQIIPKKISVTFDEQADGALQIEWGAGGKFGVERISASKVTGVSELISRRDLTSWAEFRDWAVEQKPRRYIFRGQSDPFKLSTTFHRTYRKDLNAWILDDVRRLYGAIIETVSFPLQLGNIEHNAVIWSILQHHGYPTPLLDWSFSPFVSAFFAFYAVKPDREYKPRIFIFDKVAWEEKYGRQAFIVDAAPPQLITIENMAVGNPRYTPQQALATVSNVADIEEFVRQRERADARTYLEVCDLPSTDGLRIMRELELMGITFGSLFPGLDGICKDLKDRLFAEPS